VDECLEEEDWDDPQIVTVLDETFQGVVVKNESSASQFLPIQDEECGHTK